MYKSKDSTTQIDFRDKILLLINRADHSWRIWADHNLPAAPKNLRQVHLSHGVLYTLPHFGRRLGGRVGFPL